MGVSVLRDQALQPCPQGIRHTKVGRHLVHGGARASLSHLYHDLTLSHPGYPDRLLGKSKEGAVHEKAASSENDSTNLVAGGSYRQWPKHRSGREETDAFSCQPCAARDDEGGDASVSCAADYRATSYGPSQ